MSEAVSADLANIVFSVVVVFFTMICVIGGAVDVPPKKRAGAPLWEGTVRLGFHLALYLGWVTTLFRSTESLQDEVRAVVMLGLGLVLPFFAIGWGLHWLAWRVLGPSGQVGPACFLLELTIHRHAADRLGAITLLRELYGTGSPSLDRAPVSAWTVCALAVRFERHGDALRAEAQIEALRRLPDDAWVPRRLRVYGIEALAAQAAARDDWEEVARRAALGRGRGVRLWDGLARARLGQPWPPSQLWRAWALAPARRITKPLVRETLALPETASPPPAARTIPEESPWLRHLRLLDAAARGEPFEIREVLALADAWEAPLALERQARLHQRGLDLGARDAALAGMTLLDRVLDELDRLLSVAGGSWPPPGDGFLETEVRDFHRERLFDRLAEWELLFADHADRPDLAPAEGWEEWLRLRADVERLVALGSEEDLHVAWGSGLRRVGDWVLHLHRRFREDAGWASYVIFLWIVEVARLVGDLNAEEIFTRNAEIVREMTGVVFWEEEKAG